MPCFPDLAGRIGYHDFLALICAQDAEWTRRRGNSPSAPYTSVHRQFNRVCGSYRRGINKLHGRFMNAMAQDDPRRGDHRYKEKVADWLYAPVFYRPFGRADALTLTLLDDFEVPQHITANLSTSVEELSLAVLPRLEDAIDKSELENLFWTPDQLIRESHRYCFRRDETAKRVLQHSFQKDRPLLVFTKYKLDGLATAGYALLFQQALLRAMVRKTRAALNSMADEKVPPELEISRERLSNVRCTLLELAGPEELGSLVYCDNFTVAVGVVSGLRSLTYGELFDVDDEGLVRKTLQSSRTHQQIFKLFNATTGAAIDIDSLRVNHVFRWTNSTLAVAPHACVNPQDAACHGVVEALGSYQVAPGHNATVEDHVKRAPAESGAGHKPIRLQRQNLLRYQTGRADLLEPYAEREEESRLPVVSLKSALDVIARNVNRFGTVRCNPRHCGRDVVDIGTSLTIPIPRLRDLGCDPVPTTHTAPMQIVLQWIRDAVFERPGKAESLLDRMSAGSKKGLAGPRLGRLSIELLKRVPRRIGIPLDLRHTIEFMFNNFRTCLTDPFLFDSVLDLYGAFVSLHSILTCELPRVRAQELGNPADTWLPELDRERVSILTLFIEALHNAMTHRLAAAYPETPVREMAVDFCGGLNQVLFAADAMLAWGMELLRREQFGLRSKNAPVAAVTQISFEPGISLESFELGGTLAYVKADVPHILHPATYGDYLHEFVHLIHGQLLREGGA